MDKEVEKPNLSDTSINFLEEGEKFFREQNYLEAEKYFVKSVSVDPENPLIYGRLGIIYSKNDNQKDAREALKMAVRLDPKNGFYQNNLGSILYNMGKYSEAVLYLENATKIDEKIGKRWMNLALCYQKMGKIDDAKEAILQAILLEPENKHYLKVQKDLSG